MTKNFNSSKPEWFQLVDNDALSAQVRKVDRKLPAIATVVAGAIIATGTFLTGASHESQASAQTIATGASTAVAVDPVAAKAPATPQQGGIQAPTTRGDDEDRY